MGSLLRSQARPSRDAGFTIVEVVVAALIVAIGTLAVLGIVDAASRNNYRAQQSQVVNDLLQREMEKIKQLPYAQVALTRLPTHASDPSNPNFRVSGTQFNVNKTGAVSSWNLVYDGGHSSENGGTVVCRNSDGSIGSCGIDPGPTPFRSGSVSGQIYRYVVWQPDAPPIGTCSNCAHNPNSDTFNGQRIPWFKHIVVVIALNQTAAGGIRPYQELQGDVGNPNEGQGTCTGSGCSGTSPNTATPWTFWLTDTTCDSTTRQLISGDHLTHDTLGDCPKGMTTGPPGSLGANAGAPDLMFTQATPCVGSDCSAPQPVCDYSTDVEPAGDSASDPTDCSDTDADLSGGVDKGLQLRRPTNAVNGGSGCLTDLVTQSSLSTLGSDPEWYVHQWVSDVIPSGLSNIVLDGTGGLDLWTQTIGTTPYSGRICVWLFARTVSGGAPVDTFAVSLDAHDECATSQTLTPSLTYFQCTVSSWPSGGRWSEIHIPLRFAQLTLPAGAGYRLGLAIGLERTGTSGGGLQVIYDHPNFDSRLVVDTHSGVPSGVTGWP